MQRTAPAPRTEQSPAEQARDWLASSPLFLDTETTGLDSYAEICDLAVVSHAGDVLLNTYVKPTLPIGAQAYMVHGITDDDVANAPGYLAVQQQLAPLLKGRRVITWNSDFDLRLLWQSARVVGLLHSGMEFQAACAMKLYSRFYGDWDPRRGSYRWQTLEAAARQCSVSWPTASHRALADAQTTRLILEHMARKAPAPAAAAPLEQAPLI